MAGSQTRAEIVQEGSRRRISALCLAALLLALSACATPAPQRSFRVTDLLIGLSDMPPGWTSSGPDRPVDADSCVKGYECAEIIFRADIEPVVKPTAHEVFRYADAGQAEFYYQHHLQRLHWGQTPAEWQYQGQQADASLFTCYDYQGSEQVPICVWTARYEEYAVRFRSWLIPGRMSLAEMERIVRLIDERMTQYLGRASGGSRSAGAPAARLPTHR